MGEMRVSDAELLLDLGKIARLTEQNLRNIKKTAKEVKMVTVETRKGGNVRNSKNVGQIKFGRERLVIWN